MFSGLQVSSALLHISVHASIQAEGAATIWDMPFSGRGQKQAQPHHEAQLKLPLRGYVSHPLAKVSHMAKTDKG